MTSKEFIQSIINDRGQWNEEVYTAGCEMHHIVPKSKGGTGDYLTSKGDWIFKERSHHKNCVYLTYKEHFEVHRLLSIENPTDKSLLSAYWLMAHPAMSNCNDDHSYEIDSDEYEHLRKSFIESISGENNPMYGVNVWEMYDDKRREEISAKISKSSKGRIFSAEARKKLSENNAMNRQECRQKVSDALKGHDVLDNVRKKISETKKSQHRHNTPEQKLQNSLRFKGKKWSIERREKLSKSTRGKARKKFKWLLPDGSTANMDKINAKRYHPDWVMIEGV